MNTDGEIQAGSVPNKVMSAPVGMKLDTIKGVKAMEQFSGLLNQCFGLEAPTQFLDDFPIWTEKFGPGLERALKIGVWDGEELVSCAAVRLAELNAPARPLQIALIGAVATAASHRGRGLASRTVSLAVEWARERGAAMVVLWGAETALYERLGFELCGMQVRPALASLELGPEPDFSQTVLGRGWVPSLFQCLRGRDSGLKFQDSDEKWLEAHQNVDWYWLGDPAAPLAYAALGRGIDLQGLIHEWGGTNPIALKNLLSLIRMEHPEARLLASPQLLAQWRLGAPMAQIETLGMIRTLDVKKIALSYGFSTTVEVVSSRYLFGPSEDAMPLWVWGLDAV
jgi:GNAT superfamily N-acetyltransferase